MGKRKKEGQETLCAGCWYYNGIRHACKAVIGILLAGGAFDFINLIYIISALVGGSVGGSIAGILKWNLNEGKYNQFLCNDLYK